MDPPDTQNFLDDVELLAYCHLRHLLLLSFLVVAVTDDPVRFTTGRVIKAEPKIATPTMNENQ